MIFARARIFLLLFVAARIAAAGTPIEFSAALQSFTGEGIVYQRLIFKEADRSIYYHPPPQWRCSITNNQLRLEPVDKRFAEAVISAAPLEKPAASDESALKALVQQTLSTAPSGSQYQTLVRQNLNPVLVDNNSSLEVVITFQTVGEILERSVIVINTPANQIMFKLTARKQDFDGLYRMFRSSISSWEWHAATTEPNDQHTPDKPAAEGL